MNKKKSDKEVVLEILNIVYEQRDLELLRDYIHDDAIFQMAGNKFPAGSDSVIAMYSFVHYAYPNLKFEILDQFGGDGKVCTHYRTYNEDLSFFIIVLDILVDSKIKKSIFTIDPVRSGSGFQSDSSLDLLTVMKFSRSIIEKNTDTNPLDSLLPSTDYLQNLKGKISLWERLGFMDSMKDLVVVIDRQGLLVFSNNRVFDLLGYTSEEVMGKNFEQFVYEKDKPLAENLFRKVLSRELVDNYFEIRNVKKNGEVVWLGESMSVIGEGEALKIVIVARDITQRKAEDDQLRNAYKNLHESEKKYRELIESMQLGVLEFDEHGVVTNANGEVSSTLGYEYDELLNLSFEDLIADHSSSKFSLSQAFDSNLSKGKELVEVELLTKSGNSKWFLAHFNTSEYGNIGKSGAVLIEITERILLEKNLEGARENAERARIAQDKYTANLSHEIRTPLSAIIGNVEMLEEKLGSRESKDILNDIKYASNHLVSLLDEVLDLSKLESGDNDLKYERLSIADIFNFLVTSFRKEKSDSVLLTSWLDDKIPNVLFGSKLHVTQTLLNLVGNAVKFTSKGKILVAAKMIKEDGNDVWVEFIIKDTGIGISPESLHDIFLDFKQIRKESKTNKGVGLGLPISKKLVELLGGTLEVVSEPFSGSTFSFSIPLKKKLNYDKGSLSIKATDTLVDHGIKALILEDNILNVKYFARLLDSLNIEYCVGFSGREGLSLLKHRKFDIIFTDYRMPDMDGFEFTRRIRESTGWFSKIPIIAFSASNEDEIRKFGEHAGITDFIRKPFNKQELIQMVNKQIISNRNLIEKGFSDDPVEYPLDFNQTLLHEQYNLDYSLINTMLKMALIVLDDDVAELNRLYSCGEYNGVQFMAHKLKSSFYLIGLDHVGKKLASIEKMVLSAQIEGLNSAIDQFNFLFQRSLEAIRLALDRIETMMTN